MSQIISLSSLQTIRPEVREQMKQTLADHQGCGTSGGSGKSSCGSSAGPADMAPEIWEKVKNHPCYSE